MLGFERGPVYHAVTALLSGVDTSLHLLRHLLHMVFHVILCTLYHTLIRNLSPEILAGECLSFGAILQGLYGAHGVFIQLVGKLLTIHPCHAIARLLIGHLDVMLRGRSRLLPVLSSVRCVVPRPVRVVLFLALLALLITGVAHLRDIECPEFRQAPHISKSRLLLRSTELVVHQDAFRHHVGHVPVVCVVKLFFQRCPLILGHAVGSHLVRFVHIVAELIVAANMNTHRDGTHQGTHREGSQPNVCVLLSAREVIPSVACVPCQRVKQLTFVFLQGLPRYAVVAASLQELAVFFVPILAAHLSEEVRHLAQSYLLQSFLSQSAKCLTAQKTTDHLRSVFTHLLSLGRGKSVHQSLFILYLVVALLIFGHVS